MKRDRPYLEWVRTLPCAVLALLRRTPCFGPIEAHHPTGSGLALKSPDRAAFPLCRGHHREFHDARGTFREWKKELRKSWQADRSTYYQALHENRKGAA